MASKRDSSATLDAMDVAIALAGVQDMHDVSVTILVSAAGLAGSGGLVLRAVATRNHLTRGGLLKSVSRSVAYPSDASATLEGALFKLAYDIEKDCDRMWPIENLEAE